MNSKKFTAFTFAEVLITLGIIGVVSALTMPVLLQKHQEKATVTALKKFYSVLSQAVLLNLNKNPDDYSDSNIMKSLRMSKLCEKGDHSCIKQEYKYINGNTTNVFGAGDILDDYYTAQLPDGMLIRYKSFDDIDSRGATQALQNIMGEIGVDINGDRGPNVIGRDTFFFHVTKFGVVPFGTKDDTGSWSSFENDCITEGRGYGCTAWVIYNKNLDYLHCPDELSWNGKTKCK